jgi:type II secretory pathway pseudopilin PulG
MNTLQQVDISLVGQLDEHDLNKRSINESWNESLRPPRSIVGMVFKAGVKNIWSLIGLIEKIRIRRRLGRLETTVEKQGKALTKMSEEIEKNSISIDQLTIVTQDLTRRLDSLTTRVEQLEYRIGFIETEVRIQQTMQLVDSMIGRTDQALDFAFTMLESIIQHALIGQTSAFLLPASKLEDLQDEVSKYSSATIDTAYDRMHTTIISDPVDPLSLACYINLFAVSRKSKELVRLIPVPNFSGNQAFAPALDYTLVLLDQEAGVFTALDANEEENCLADKCLVSNPEMATSAPSCGIPQLFDRQLSSCINEDVYSNGMFLKQLLHDGIVYSVKQTTDIQIFCQLSKMSKQQKISGSGVVHLPPGCSLALTNNQGVVSRIFSPPQTHLVETQSVELIPTGPKEIFQPASGVNPNATTNVVRLLNQQLEELDHKLAITRFEVDHQNVYVIVLGTLLGVVTIVCIVIALLLYRYSRRFRRRVKKVANEFSTNLHEAKRQFVTFEQMMAHRAREDEAVAPLIPSRPTGPEVQGHGLEARHQPGRADRRAFLEPMALGQCCSRPLTKPGHLKKHDSTQSILDKLAALEFEVLALSSGPDTSTTGSGYVEPGDIENGNRSRGASFRLDKEWRPPVPPKSGNVLARPYQNKAPELAIELHPLPKPTYFGDTGQKGERPF